MLDAPYVYSYGVLTDPTHRLAHLPFLRHVACSPRGPPTIPGAHLRVSVRLKQVSIRFDLQHILRLLNTNVDGKRKIMYALTEIKGVGRRYSNLVCKKADVDLNKRYAEFRLARYALSSPGFLNSACLSFLCNSPVPAS